MSSQREVVIGEPPQRERTTRWPQIVFRLEPFLSVENLRRHLQTPFYTNAYYLMANTVVNSLLGFVFWAVLARLYAPDQVGIASAVISAMVFLTGLSELGLGAGLIRFLPGAGESGERMLDSSLTFITLLSLVVAIVFLVGLPLWSPALTFMYDQPVFLISFVLVVSLFTWGEVINQIFIAHRAAHFTLLRCAVMSILRILLLIPCAIFGGQVLGIFAAVGIAVAVSLGMALIRFLPAVQKGYFPRPRWCANILSDLLPYSAGNFVATFLTQTSRSVIILPLLVLNVLGAKASAYSYVVWMVANMLFMISAAVSTSTFAEGSNEEELLGDSVQKAWRLTLLLLAPAILLILVVGNKLLLLFGRDYVEGGASLLTILAFSALPVGVNNIYFAIKRVTKEIGIILVLSLFIAGGTLGGSYLLIPHYGIVGTGIGWLVSQGIVSGLVLFSIWRKTRFGFPKSAKDRDTEALPV